MYSDEQLLEYLGVNKEAFKLKFIENEKRLALFKKPKTYQEVKEIKKRNKNKDKKAIEFKKKFNLSGDIFYSPEYDCYLYDSQTWYDSSDILDEIIKESDSEPNFLKEITYFNQLATIDRKALDWLGDTDECIGLSTIAAMYDCKKRLLGIDAFSLLNLNTESGDYYANDLIGLEKTIEIIEKTFKNQYKHLYTKEMLYGFWRESYLNNENFSEGYLYMFKKRYDKEFVGVKERKDKLRELLDDNGEVKIYRGIRESNKDAVKNLSWTLSKSVAEKFAVRYHTEAGYVIEATIHFDDIYDTTINNGILGSEEFEVLVDATKLKNINIEKLTEERKKQLIAAVENKNK